MSDERISVLIMAGGRSRRMGQDKLWMLLADKPLIQHVAESILPLAREVLFSANAVEPFAALAAQLPIPVRIVSDAHPGAGPLAGLRAGLSAMSGELLLALGGDMPFVNLALVARMIALAPGFDAVVPETPHPLTGELLREPLHALYRRTCLPAVAARLAAGDHRIVSFYPQVRVRAMGPDEIGRFDPDHRSFFNVNTLEDWAVAQQWIRE